MLRGNDAGQSSARECLPVPHPLALIRSLRGARHFCNAERLMHQSSSGGYRASNEKSGLSSATLPHVPYAEPGATGGAADIFSRTSGAAQLL